MKVHLTPRRTVLAVPASRLRNWRSGDHTPYPGMLHDPESDSRVDWQDLVLKVLWRLPEGTKVSISLDIEEPGPGEIQEDDYWVLLSPHTYGHNVRDRKKKEGS